MSIIMETISFASAGNTDDKSWKFDYNGDGSDGSCIARKKEDNTYTYVKCDSGNPRALEVYAGASKGIGAGDSGTPFGSDYSTPAHTIKPGTRIYFENKQNKKDIQLHIWCFLIHSIRLENIREYGVLII